MERATHLIMLVHGLLGSEFDFQYFASLLQQHLSGDPFHAFVHIAQCNASGFFATYDGVDAGGERLAKEIQSVASKMPQLSRFSIIGHSLGGLYSRYAIGLLFSRGFFDRVIPMNFITLASPHLGILRPQRGGFNALYNALSPTLFSKTSTQLSLRDSPSDQTLQLANRTRAHWNPKDCKLLVQMKGDLLVQLLVPPPSGTTTTNHLVSDTTSKNQFDLMEAELMDQKLHLYWKSDEDGNQPEQEEIADQSKPVAMTLDLMDLHARVVLPSLVPVPKQSTSLRDLFKKIKSRRSDIGRDSSSSRVSGSSDKSPVVHTESDPHPHLHRHHPHPHPHGGNRWQRRPNAVVDVHLMDQHQSVVILRFKWQELGTQWKWLVALSNNCLGAIDCVVEDRADQDKAESERLCTLQCLSQGQFLQALALFPFRALYGNVFCDMNVSYTGSCLRAYNPYRNHQLSVALSSEYCHLMSHSIAKSTFRRKTKQVIAGRCEDSEVTESVQQQQEEEPETSTSTSTSTLTPDVALTELGETLLNMVVLGSSSSQSNDERYHHQNPNDQLECASMSSVLWNGEAPPAQSKHASKSFSLQENQEICSSASRTLCQSHSEHPNRQHDEKHHEHQQQHHQHQHHTTKLHRPQSHPSLHGDEARPLPFDDEEDTTLLLDQLDNAFGSVRARELLRTLLLRLQSIGWHRVDVLIESVLAHEKIIAKRTNASKPHENGVDVVHHVMDTMLL